MRRRDTLFDIAKLREQLEEKRALSETPEIFLDLKKAQQISREIASLENKVSVFDKAETTIQDTADMIELAEEENDESVVEFIVEVVGVGIDLAVEVVGVGVGVAGHRDLLSGELLTK